MVKLASPRFKVNVKIMKVCLKTLSGEEKENIFEDCIN